MRTWFRNLLPVGAVYLVPLVSGCTPNPDFTPPVGWESSRYEIQMGVQLNQDGVGYVQNMPIGTAIEDESDGYCIQDSEERYSGPITWKTITEYNFEISFGDSNYVISDGAGKFGSQSWDELRIPVCGEQPEFWSLHAVCGDTGLGYLDLPACS